MDAPVYKKLTDIENQRENPFNTAEGQEIVSISENFWSRLARQGRFRGNMWDAQSIAVTSSWNWNAAWAHGAEPGYRMFLKRVVMSADVDCQLGFKIWEGVQGTTNTYHQMSAYVKAGTPWVVEFDGEYVVESVIPPGQTAPGIYFGVNKVGVAGNVYISVVGVEVAANA